MLTRGLSGALSGAPKPQRLFSRFGPPAAARGAAIQAPFQAPSPSSAAGAAGADEEADVASPIFKFIDGIRWIFIRTTGGSYIGVDAASPRCAAAAAEALRNVKPDGTLGGPTCYYDSTPRFKSCACEPAPRATLGEVDSCLTLPPTRVLKIRDIVSQDSTVDIIILIKGLSMLLLDRRVCMEHADSKIPTAQLDMGQFCSCYGEFECGCRYPTQYADIENVLRGDEKIAFVGHTGAVFQVVGSFVGNPDMLVPYLAGKEAKEHMAAKKEEQALFNDTNEASRLRGRGWIAAHPDHMRAEDVRGMSDVLLKNAYLVVPPSVSMFELLRRAIDGGGDGVVAGGMFAPIQDGEKGDGDGDKGGTGTGTSSDDGAIDVSAVAGAILAAAAAAGGGGSPAAAGGGGSPAAAGGGGDSPEVGVGGAAPVPPGVHGVPRSRKWVVIDSEGFRSTDMKCSECVAATNAALDEIGPDGILEPTCAYHLNPDKPCNCEVIAEEWAEVGDAFCTGDEVLVTFRFARRPDMRTAYHAAKRAEEAARWAAAGLEPYGAPYLCSEDDHADDATTFERGVQPVASKKRRGGGGGGGGGGEGGGEKGGAASKKARGT